VPKPSLQNHTSIKRRSLLTSACALVFGWAELTNTHTAFGRTMDYETEKFKWSIDVCAYGIDIDPRAYIPIKTLSTDNWLKDADGNLVALFYTGFGAAWGSGATPMGGPSDKGARLPKTLRLTYYDYLEDRFYQLDAELPQQRIYELFKQKTVSNDLDYGKVTPRFNSLRIGVAPQGNIMLWVTGETDQVELGAYQAVQVMKDQTPKSYNATLPGGRSFTLDENRDRALASGRAKPETVARIKAGWRPSPNWYMRDIRVKYPWRFRLTGAAARMVELESFQGNAESQSVGAWEMHLYQSSGASHAVPETAKFWFVDATGQRHHLWLSFYKRERALSEADLSEVLAAFEKMFGKRTMEDNEPWPLEKDMATVEVNVGEDFKTFTATLVKGDVRLPLVVGRTQYFALNPHAHWPKQKTPEPDVRQLFLSGPPA
jgi:Protein of unknown function (DUF2931)